jgi:hypothetical protein
MINIFFVPGMFGSTIEYMLTTFTQEYTAPELVEVLEDGSMHSYKKRVHLLDNTQILSFLESDNKDCITTPIYPFKDMHLPEILKELNFVIDKSNHSFLLYADSLRSAELNMLFQYYKIANGSKVKLGLDIFCNGNDHNFRNWNKNYNSWQDMQIWELREWLSLFYVNWVKEWQESIEQVPSHFICIKNTEFLYNPLATILKIFQHCGLTVDKNNMDEFVETWQEKQQYIVNEFDLLDQIEKCAMLNQEFTWKPISLVSEAIIQQRLRSQGYEIQCDGLNNFPVDAESLYKLLYKC